VPKAVRVAPAEIQVPEHRVPKAAPERPVAKPPEPGRAEKDTIPMPARNPDTPADGRKMVSSVAMDYWEADFSVAASPKAATPVPGTETVIMPEMVPPAVMVPATATATAAVPAVATAASRVPVTDWPMAMATVTLTAVAMEQVMVLHTETA
jgi:hypothetical protein